VAHLNDARTVLVLLRGRRQRRQALLSLRRICDGVPAPTLLSSKLQRFLHEPTEDPGSGAGSSALLRHAQVWSDEVSCHAAQLESLLSEYTATTTATATTTTSSSSSATISSSSATTATALAAAAGTDTDTGTDDSGGFHFLLDRDTKEQVSMRQSTLQSHMLC
jgi:hypothetical protein